MKKVKKIMAVIQQQSTHPLKLMFTNSLKWWENAYNDKGGRNKIVYQYDLNYVFYNINNCCLWGAGLWVIFFLLLLYNFLSFPNYNQKKIGQGGRSEPVIISNWVEENLCSRLLVFLLYQVPAASIQLLL